MDCSLPGSSIHGIFQATVLEWGAIAFSVSHFTCVQLFVTAWTVAHQAPLSMGFSRREYWIGLLFPSPGSKSRSVMSNSASPWDFLGQNTEVGSYSLLQGIFPTQGLNPGLLHCRQILCLLSYQGNS